MDSIGFNESFLLNLQLDQFQQQFKNSCARLNILTNDLKPTEFLFSRELKREVQG